MLMKESLYIFHRRLRLATITVLHGIMLLYLLLLICYGNVLGRCYKQRSWALLSLVLAFFVCLLALSGALICLLALSGAVNGGTFGPKDTGWLDGALLTVCSTLRMLILIFNSLL